MNKAFIVLCIIVAVFFINTGLSMNSQVVDYSRKIVDIRQKNNAMEMEISKKLQLPEKQPVAFSKAFSLVINEVRYLEANSGTAMNLSISTSQDNEDIASRWTISQYHGVKKLPVTLQVDKFSNETDMSEALNDIYQLELETDFKVSGINIEGDTLLVKGDIYGI